VNKPDIVVADVDVVDGLELFIDVADDDDADDDDVDA
jgi:hypothetical protein